MILWTALPVVESPYTHNGPDARVETMTTTMKLKEIGKNIAACSLPTTPR